MITLINANRMWPPIAPIGLDYLAAAVRRAGVEVDLLDLCWIGREDAGDGPQAAVARHFARCSPRLVGISLRNVDDCFWPSGVSFLPELKQVVAAVRAATSAPVVLGGVGFSIFARRIVEWAGTDFGIHGDGEASLVRLFEELRGGRRLERVPGLVYRRDGRLRANLPAWPQPLDVHGDRDAVDNAAYFRLGGQIGLETKRGCGRRCLYCADPVAKGTRFRLRDPAAVADEVEHLLAQGIDVLHLCDGEFNLPADHALAICDEWIRRRLGDRVRWYAYLAVAPFSDELARRMRRAGCVGINFTSDAAAETMLAAYGHPHRREDLAAAVRHCRRNEIAVMLDMLLGGPGETPETLADTIGFFQRIHPDCAGAALGVRVFPGTPMAEVLAAAGPPESNPSVRRHYAGPVDLLQPTFYIASTLGPRPAQRVRDLIAGDPRFFEPEDEPADGRTAPSGDHNYNDNRALADAIAAGARGAYWDVLRKLRGA